MKDCYVNNFVAEINDEIYFFLIISMILLSRIIIKAKNKNIVNIQYKQ